MRGRTHLEPFMAMYRSRTHRTSLALATFLLLPLATGIAQDSTRTTTVADTAHAHKTLFTAQDAALAAGFAGLTVAMFPVDRRVARELRDPEAQANRFFDRAATGFEVFTSPGAYVIGAGLYTAGRITHHADLADLGWHGTESILLATVVTDALKMTLGRARPFASADTLPHDFKLGGGFGNGDRQSFPSGHTTTAFAAAASVTSEIHRLHPAATWIVGPVLYGGATMVGLSRMYHDKHWASDVVLGAAIGTFSGLKVVRYSHSHPDNKLDSFILGTAIAPDGNGGVLLAWSLPAP